MGTSFPSPNSLVTPLVGTVSVQVAQANPQRLGLFVFNPSNVVTLWVSPDGVLASTNGIGSVAIQPLQGIMFGPPNTPPWTNSMNAIASAGGSNVIGILEYYS